jgi:hypothetical protein
MNQVWEVSFIQNRVLETEYERRGISVSTDEIVRPSELAAGGLPQRSRFQTDSQLDMNKYQRWLTSSGRSISRCRIADYRDQLRRSPSSPRGGGRHLLGRGALGAYRDENEQVKVAVTAIIRRNAVLDSAVKLTDEEVTALPLAPDDFKRSRTAS